MLNLECLAEFKVDTQSSQTSVISWIPDDRGRDGVW